MVLHAVVAWLMLAGFLMLGLFAVALSHFILTGVAQSGRHRKNIGRRVRVCFFAAGFVFLQLFGQIYDPGAAYLLQAKCAENADDDDQGDPESPKKQLSRQLKRIRRGEPVDALVLRLRAE